MMRKRLAIISATGTALKRTIPAIIESKSCEIVAIHGRDQAKLANISKTYSIHKYYLDYAEMLEEIRPDFVFIGSPPNFHINQIRKCLNFRIPVLCEKPLCLNLVEAHEICSLSNKLDVPIRIAHQVRLQPGIKKLKSLIQSQQLGQPRRIAMQWSYWLDENKSNAKWKLDPTTGGSNTFYDAGIHAIDLLVHLVGKPSKIVALNDYSRFSNYPDNVSVLAKYDNVIAELNASHAMEFPLNQLTIDFEKGSVFIPRALGEESITEIKIVSFLKTEELSLQKVNLYGEEIRDFIELLEGKSSIGTTTEEAISALEILEAITKSYIENRTISLKGLKQ